MTDADREKAIDIAFQVDRFRINLMAVLGILVFGWLITLVFDRLAKGWIGWLYFAATMCFSMIVSMTGDPEWLIVAATIYLVACIHANVLLSYYQSIARTEDLADMFAAAGISAPLLPRSKKKP